ncbi:tyrosine-type recombinase/integrase [Bacillus cereus]
MASFRKRGVKWEYRIKYIDYSTGKKRETTKGGFKTKKEAQIAAAKIEEDIRQNTFVKESNMTMYMLIDKWIQLKTNSYKPTTFSVFSGIMHNRIAKKFGYANIRNITTLGIQEWYVNLQNEGLTPKYIRTIHNVLRALFNDAKSWGLISNNIMNDVSPPKIPKHPRNFLTLDMALNVIEYAKNNTNHGYTIELALFTGMRRGEINGLKWMDINMDKKLINISRQANSVSGKGVIIQTPKTSQSVRLISIPEFLVDSLKEWQLIQKKECLKYGQPWTDDFFVTTASFKPTDGKAAGRALTATCNALEYPHVRFHDLRHSHASIMLEIGENLKSISERLGHKSISITMDLYSHISLEMKEISSDRLNKAVKTRMN